MGRGQNAFVPRSQPGRSWLLGLIAFGCCVAAPSVRAQASSPTLAAACDAAVSLAHSVVSRESGKAWVVAESPDAVYTSSAEMVTSLTSAKWSKDRPSDRLINVFASARPKSAVKACPNLRSLLKISGVAYGDAAAERMASFQPVGKDRVVSMFFKGAIWTLTLPIVSNNGNEALAREGVSCGVTCGSGAIVHLRRSKDGRWSVTDVLDTWIG